MKTLIVSMILSLQLILFPATASAGTSGAAYAKAVSSLSLGIVGSTIAAMCPNGMFYPSVSIILAGGISMVAGDLVLSKKYTDYQKKKKSELKLNESEMKDSNGDFQKEVIEQRLSMEKEELKNIKGRELLHYALGVVFTAASAVAVAETMIPYYYISNPVVICNPVTGEVMGLAVSQLIMMSWQIMASMGGGASGAGEIFSILQMALGLMTKVNAKITSTAASTSASRAIFAGANAALMYWVAGDLSAKKKIAEENIAKLEELKKKVKETETPEGTDAGLGNYADGDNQNPNAEMNIKELPQVAEAKSCFSTSGGSPSFGSSSCKTAVKLSPINFNGGLNIPELQSVSGSAITATNALAGGNWAGAEVAFADINSKAAKIRNISDELQKKYNENMKSQGKPTIDFKAEIAKQVAAIDSEVAKAMGMPASSLAAAPQATISKDEAAKEEVASSASSPVVAPVADIPSMDLSGIGGGMEQADVSGEAPAKSLDDSLGEYEVAENDIAKDPGVSIFKQVSNRYILNYRQFFSAAKKSLVPTEAEAEKTSPAASP